MPNVYSIPAEVALLGRWGLEGDDVASLCGPLNLRKYAMSHRSTLWDKEVSFTKELGDDEFFECGFDQICHAARFGEHIRQGTERALELTCFPGNLTPQEHRCRLWSLARGGLWFSRFVGDHQFVGIVPALMESLVVVKYNGATGYPKFRSIELNYLNQLAKSFRTDKPIDKTIALLGELLEAQHRTVVQRMAGRNAYCEFYNHLKLLGGIGGRLIGNCLFMVCSPDRVNELLNSTETAGMQFLPIEFSYLGAEVRHIQ